MHRIIDLNQILQALKGYLDSPELIQTEIQLFNKVILSTYDEYKKILKLEDFGENFTNDMLN
jgi:hypothetical protein